MAGAAEIDKLENLAAKSFAAGADMLLFGRDIKKTREAFEFFREKWQEGVIKSDRQKDAGKRVDMLLQKVVS
jgi:hypothetical protein